MRRFVFTASMALVCLCGTAFGQIYNNNYYFSPNSLPNYTDVTTVKATEQVNSEEVITVGFAREPLNNLRNDIVVVKTKATSGVVIWAHRYGLKDLDERAYGLDLTYNGKDIIVVGSAQDKDNPTDWNALAMRIELSTGNVLWSGQYGATGTREEWRTVEKVYGPFTPFAPTYFLAGSTSSNNQKSILYAGAIFENGSTQYLNRYDEVFASNFSSDFAYTMVKNKENNFILTGTRYEDTQPSRIFTLGINPFNGSVSDKYLFYGVDTDNHYGGAIDELFVGNDRAYALAFTTGNPGVDNNVRSAITVMLLNEDREPKWVNYYWRDKHSRNVGLAIFQNQVEEKLLNIYNGTYKDDHTPGFLSVDLSDGDVNYFIKYNTAVQNNSKFATSMVEATDFSFGYLAKGLHRDGENGFMLASLGEYGRTECADTDLMNKKERQPSVAKRTYNPSSYGTIRKRKLDKEQVHGKAEECDGTNGYSFRLAATEATEIVETAETFHAYPNPLARDGGNLQLAYTILTEKAVEVSVFNALGQQTALRNVALSAGSQVLELENNLLSPGLNLVTVRSEGEVLFQARIMMH